MQRQAAQLQEAKAAERDSAVRERAAAAQAKHKAQLAEQIQYKRRLEKQHKQAQLLHEINLNQAVAADAGLVSVYPKMRSVPAELLKQNYKQKLSQIVSQNHASD